MAAGVSCSWVASDEAYGDNGAFRAGAAALGLRYVLAVSCDHRVPAGGEKTVRADVLAAKLPAVSWQRISAGTGSKGPRFYDWAWIDMPGQPGCSLLIRRSLADGELAFYRCWAPEPTPLATLVRVAGARWAVEENFQAADHRRGRHPGDRA